MDTQLEGGKPAITRSSGQQLPIDPLRRVFVPIERRNIHGVLVFKTSDKKEYYRNASGGIRSRFPKINGKVARKQRARVRHDAHRS